MLGNERSICSININQLKVHKGSKLHREYWWQLREDPRRVVGISGGVNGTAFYGGTTGLLVVQVTGYSTTHRPKTLGVWSFELMNCVLCCFVSLWSYARPKCTLVLVCSVVLEQMPSGWVIATCHLLWNLAHVYPPAFLAGIFSCLANTTIQTLQKVIPFVLILCDVWLLFTANFDVNTSLWDKHSLSFTLSFLNKLAWRPKFNPRPVCMGILVAKVTLGLLLSTLVFPCQNYYTTAPYAFIRHQHCWSLQMTSQLNCHNSISWCYCM
jgi:hypothetical protein